VVDYLDTKKNLRIAHLQLDIACWEDHIASNKLSDSDIKLYMEHIENAKEKLKKELEMN
jgi:hypothetical protein